MKEKFEEPVIEVVEFSVRDVEVVTSSGTGFFSQPDLEPSDK